MSLLSAVGQDPFGDEILEVAKNKGVNVQFVGRARIGLPTGTVVATVDAMGNATYEFVQPVAWDEVIVSAEALEAVAKAGAFIFGSLASRSPYNLEQVDRLLAVKGPLKFFDVNLRPPFADPKRIVELAARADIIKLNHDEVGKIASWLRTGEATPNPPMQMQMPSRKLVQFSRKQQTRLASASPWLKRVRRCGIGAAFFPLLLPKWSSRTQLARGTRSWPA